MIYINLNVKSLIIGALVAILFYFLAIWVLDLIKLVVPNIILALIAILIFLGFATVKVNV